MRAAAWIVNLAVRCASSSDGRNARPLNQAVDKIGWMASSVILLWINVPPCESSCVSRCGLWWCSGKPCH